MYCGNALQYCEYYFMLFCADMFLNMKCVIIICRSVLTLLCWSWFYTLQLQFNPKIVMNLKTAHCDISPISLYFINVSMRLVAVWWWRLSLLRWPAVTLTSCSFTAGGKSFVCLFVGLFVVSCSFTADRKPAAACARRGDEAAAALRSESDKHPAETCFQHVVENKLQLSLSAASSCDKTINIKLSHTQKCDIITQLSFMTLSCVSVNKQKHLYNLRPLTCNTWLYTDCQWRDVKYITTVLCFSTILRYLYSIFPFSATLHFH